MYHFEYVTKAEAAPVKKELIAIINAVQDLLRDHFTFRFDFIGSSARNIWERTCLLFILLANACTCCST